MEKVLKDLMTECERIAAKSHAAGLRYYFVGYAVTVISVLASIVAGALALWDDAVSREAVGTIALLPAFGATIGVQFRLVEKANWHYDLRSRMQAMARNLRLLQAQPAQADVQAATETLNETLKEFDQRWPSFTFTPPKQTP